MAAVAALYDIHGNLAALEAVLAEVPDDATIVVGGDVSRAGRSRARRSSGCARSATASSGYAATPTASCIPGEEGLAPPGALDSTRAALSEEEIEFLHELPETQLIDDVLYCHASPRNDVDIFTERTPEERIAFLFDGLDVSTVVCGHTHTQYERRVAGVRLVNAGSVGMPYEEEPGAYWLLDLDHRRTPYEGAELEATREEAVAEFTERGL